MAKWRIVLDDGYCVYERLFVSRSGYFSIADIFAIIEANTDLKRMLPAKEGNQQSHRTTKRKPKRSVKLLLTRPKE